MEPHLSFDATIRYADGGYSSAAERLTVAQDVVGSIPTSRPNSSTNPENSDRADALEPIPGVGRLNYQYDQFGGEFESAEHCYARN